MGKEGNEDKGDGYDHKDSVLARIELEDAICEGFEVLANLRENIRCGDLQRFIRCILRLTLRLFCLQVGFEVNPDRFLNS